MTNLEELLTEIQQAAKNEQSNRKARACAQVGQIYLERNLQDQAAPYFQEASRIYDREDKSEKQAQSLNHLGVCQMMAGRSAESTASLKSALAVLQSDAAPEMQAAIQGNLGLVLSSQDDYQGAFAAHKSVLETAERLGDHPLRLNALINLADCRMQDGKYRSAQGFALVALDLAKELSPHPGLMIALDLLGMISSRLGDLVGAVDYHQRAYQAALEFGDLQHQGIALANQGLALEALTELEQAKEALELAQKIFIKLNSDYRVKTGTDLARIRKGLQR